MFVERGVEGTSIEQIARRAGVAKLTVYRRWKSKEELIAQAIDAARVRLAGTAETSLDGVDDLPVRELVAAIVPDVAVSLARPELRALIARTLGVTVSHPELARVYWQHHSQPRRQATRALLERAKREGILAEHIDPDVLMDMINGAVIHRLLQPDPPDAAEMREYLTKVYRQVGLLP
ncbi:MAG: TetR family transcriptional regulator [Streptosporangiales bacterium]|nr:TetR family transcriptional regulator [Streptosporangiales bacterium]